MENFKQMIATRLRSAREDAGFTQGELADVLGMARSTYTQIETGRNALSIEHLVKLSETLNRPVHYFLGLPEPCSRELPEDELWILGVFRSLSAGTKKTVLAMLRGLSGQPVPAIEPAPAPDVDSACRLLARLDSAQLEMAVIFIRWLVEQPGMPPEEEPEARKKVTRDDVARFFASLDSGKRETLLTNLIEMFWSGKNLDNFGDTHSEPNPKSDRESGQGKLF